MDHTALLLIDLQRDFLEANGRMAVSAVVASQVVSLANRLIQHGENAGWKLIFIRNEYPKSELIGNLFRKGAAIEGSRGAELDPRVIVPFSGLVLTKSRPDAFTNPELEETLASGAVHQLVVLGVMAEGCVRATAKGALNRGFAVTVVSDAVASSRGLFWRFGMRSMKNAGAIIKEGSEVLNPNSSPP
jgi:nicotinamidase-related amidase